MTKFEIADQFSEGFVAGVLPQPVSPGHSAHWHAGYRFGHTMHDKLDVAINEYLARIGVEQMAKASIQ